MVDIYHFKSCIVRVAGDLVSTNFSDSRSIRAYPQPTEEYEAKARSLGYMNGAEMNREHDLTHMRISNWLGLDTSPTLWAIAHDDRIPDELSGAEEDAVLALQKYLNILEKHGII